MSDALEIYLHDHLGAAEVAIDLLADWRDDNEHPRELREFCAALHTRIESDRETLRRIAARVGDKPHSVKEAAGRLSRFKLNRRDLPALARLEGLELLALGILGKLALWKSLSTIASTHLALRGVDLEKLAEDARMQHAEVEAWRLTAAAEALRS